MAREDLLYEDEFDEEEDSMEDMYLTFKVHDRDFGVDIKNVVEIVVLPSITEVPDLPGFVKGIINLRGKVIPLVDMRSRFQMVHADYSERTCVIIIESNELLVGLIVDAVNEVLKIAKNQLEDAPKIGKSITSRFVEKIAKVGEEVKIILNLERLLNEDEMAVIGDMNKPGEVSAQNEEKKEAELAVK